MTEHGEAGRQPPSGVDDVLIGARPAFGPAGGGAAPPAPPAGTVGATVAPVEPLAATAPLVRAPFTQAPTPPRAPALDGTGPFSRPPVGEAMASPAPPPGRPSAMVRAPRPDAAGGGDDAGASRDGGPGDGASGDDARGHDRRHRGPAPASRAARRRRRASLADGHPRLVRVALLAAALGAVVGAVVGGAVVWVQRPAGGASAPSSTVSGEGTGVFDIHALIAEAQPAVVAIHTDGEKGAGVFGSAGSGVLISDDGLVLTNNHVVNTVTKVTVVGADGTDHPGEFVGSSPDDDIALVRVAGLAGITPARLGSSADVRVGDEVVAIGNALDLGGSASVTRGIVSAKDRSIRNGSLYLRNLLQTDAAINPGNSGGPLLNRAGEVVGINTAIVSDAQNVGFAISIDAVKPLIDDLRDGKGKVTPDTAYLGVTTTSVKEVSEAVRAQFRITVESGAFVQEITDNSAAADAGLELGDVIVRIGGVDVHVSSDVGVQVRSHRAGDVVRLDVRRRGEAVSVDVTLRARRATGG